MASEDVVIIGGGVMGCLIALRLSQRGRGVLVLERSVPGAEASSAAAGMLAPQQEAEEPGLGLSLGLASRARFPALVKELEEATGLDLGYRRAGLLVLAPTAEEMAHLDAKCAWQRALGLPVERLDPRQLADLEPALARMAGALRFPEEAQVEPPLLMRALQVAAARAGVTFTRARVRRIRHGAGRVEAVEVDTDEALAGHVAVAVQVAPGSGDRRCVDELRPRDVVVAAGSWSALVEGSAIPPGALRPVRGQMVELQTRPASLSHIVFAPGGYLVPRGDGRVTVGSTMEEAGFHKAVTAGALSSLLAAAARAVPALSEAAVVRFWSNFRPATADHLPFIGPTHIGGLHLATGHFRNGILLAPLTADAVAAAVCQDTPPIDLAPFSPSRLR